MTHVELQGHLKKEIKVSILRGKSIITICLFVGGNKEEESEEKELEEEDYKRFLIENKPQKKTPRYKEIAPGDDLDELEKSEDELDVVDGFEFKYNFRFEETDKLMGYSRTIDDSVRIKDGRRKNRRQAAKQHKKEGKVKQFEELMRVKSLKKQEIDLRTEFNPENYNQKAESVSNDEYYNEYGNVKPVFDSNIDTADYEQSDNEGFADNQEDGCRRRRRSRCRSGFFIVGDLPARFKYHKVMPTNFGQSPVEILLADGRGLNVFVSLKKFAPYRRPDLQMNDIKKYSRAKRVHLFRHNSNCRFDSSI
ncbi:KRRI-Interacting protein 1 [Mortierella polycephala]|uniref:KRRI-Interacting protein 1 n=1 Tax=Mortierella polycephala TaxID=41804 RepID=A0A9P6QI23_9FUNG|nr:KRRI-Interacting protein 1 [Mortierella polycephala]